jgi:protein involved in polysaccharide export with SLBB domain
MSRCLASLVLGVGVLMGCNSTRSQLRSLLEVPPQSHQNWIDYTLRFPDRVEIIHETRPEFSGEYLVHPDGNLHLANYATVQAVGLTTEQIAENVARETGSDPKSVKCRVTVFRSRYVQLFGPVHGDARAIPYQGHETVVEFLQRAGGVSRLAEPRKAWIVRDNVAVGLPPERLEVDLEAILIKGDPTTNYTVQPNDEIYVEPTRRSEAARILPDWLRPNKRK